MKNYINYKILPYIFCIATIVGCGGAYKASEVYSIPLEQREKIIYKSFWLKVNVGILSIDQEYNEGFLKAKVKFKNLTSSLVNAELKIKFLDREGYELNETWGWSPFPLESGEIKSYQQIAPSNNAVDYRILLKLASDKD